MQLPRSLNGLRDLTSRAHMGTPSANSGNEDPKQVRAMGTRKTIDQGTQKNVADPLTGQVPGGLIDYAFNDHAYFSTDKEMIPGAPGTIVQTHNWPANPSINLSSESGGRESQEMMSGDLQTGPAPGRIWRGLPARYLGGNTGDFGADANGPGFPWNGDLQHIDHIWAARHAQGTKGQYPTLADDNAQIPAVFAGNAR